MADTAPDRMKPAFAVVSVGTAVAALWALWRVLAVLSLGDAGSSLSDAGVHSLEPILGTDILLLVALALLGAFVARRLSSGFSLVYFVLTCLAACVFALPVAFLPALVLSG